MSVLCLKIKSQRGNVGPGCSCWGSGEGMLRGCSEGKCCFFPSAAFQGFCPRGAGVQQLATAWPLSLAHLLGIVCESQARRAFNSLHKAGRTVLSAELCCSCACTQVELIPSSGIPWDRGKGWSVPWQRCGANLLQSHMQSIDFSTCEQQF